MPEMKIITLRGTISADGQIKCGTGFTVTHLATGVYLIKFDIPFFMKNPEGQIKITATGKNAKIVNLDLTSLRYFTIDYEPNKMVLKDYEVEFQAVGMISVC